ncbi:MAG: DUF3575 domain-containing protein [Alistipes sp.]|jgi:tetratricopeptide (TPR) repeat protein|nr:DUF3575 domain-containing protein [Alistipes sp.]
MKFNYKIASLAIFSVMFVGVSTARTLDSFEQAATSVGRLAATEIRSATEADRLAVVESQPFADPSEATASQPPADQPATTEGISSAENQPLPVPVKGDWRDEWTLPTWNIKTNLLYDATTTMNIGVEFRTGPKNSLEIPISWNPWSFNGGRTKIKHLLIQPEFRWWPNGVFNGNSFGIHAHYTPPIDGAGFNVGGLPSGPFTKYMNDHRFQGWLAGVGVSWGYRWNFNRHWALEAVFGIGYTYLDYGKYPCTECGALITEQQKHYFGITKAGVNLIYGLGAKRKPAEQVVYDPVVVVPAVVAAPPAPIAPIIPAVAMVEKPILAAMFVIPEAEVVKARKESGRAYLEFETGRWEILPSFSSNAAELRRIHELVRPVKTDPETTITGMTLTGYASPEDDFGSNMTLSERRAESLRQYLQGIYGFGNLMTSRGAGEDWQTLAQLVDEANMLDEHVLLDIINGGGNPDARENRLKRVSNGVPYRAIHVGMYPKLRRTDYVVEYEVAPIATQRGKEILHSRPGNLSLNEMFVIAQTYDTGSEEFKEVFDIAVRVYPDSDVAKLNAAAIALERGNSVEAKRYLDRVEARDAVWWNNAGVLAWLEGNLEEATRCFEKAGAISNENAVKTEAYIRAVGNAGTAAGAVSAGNAGTARNATPEAAEAAATTTSVPAAENEK